MGGWKKGKSSGRIGSEEGKEEDMQKRKGELEAGFTLIVWAVQCL